MAWREFHYRWEYRLRSEREALWPYVTDTNRFNRDTGLPYVQDAEKPAADLVNARRRLRLRRMGVPIEWEEEPFEWVRPLRFGVRRVYATGPVAEMRTLGELAARPEGGTDLVYQVWARPRSVVGLAAIPLQIGWLSASSFARTFRLYDQLASKGELPGQAAAEAVLAPGGRQRLDEARKFLMAEGASDFQIDRLFDLVSHADEITLSRLRPYALADYWHESRRAILELFLQATRAGLLDLQWHILCPLCRGAKETVGSLGELHGGIHCEICHIDLTGNFDRAVELTFRPNPAVRTIDVHPYCIGGPQVTPHILAQQLLQPQAERVLTFPLEPGRHRLRALELRGGEFLSAAADGAPEITISASRSGWPNVEPLVDLTPTIHLINETDQEQLVLLERMAWSDDAATAAEVTTLQAFRDLFSSEVLRPGEKISVGSLTIVFTDIRDSTRLYRAIGDAPAFGLVMDHFDVLRDAVVAENGAVVKTIGDSVMAAFRHPVAALRAVLEAQARLHAVTDGDAPLVLKAGIHHGPCIAVTLNDRLDYFGSTVNIASRLQGLSAGDDIVISAAVRDDPEVVTWWAATGDGIAAEHYQTTLKGFEGVFDVARVTRKLKRPESADAGR